MQYKKHTRISLTFVNTTAIAYGQKVDRSLKILVYAIAVVFTNVRELRVQVLFSLLPLPPRAPHPHPFSASRTSTCFTLARQLDPDWQQGSPSVHRYHAAPSKSKRDDVSLFPKLPVFPHSLSPCHPSSQPPVHPPHRVPLVPLSRVPGLGTGHTTSPRDRLHPTSKLNGPRVHNRERGQGKKRPS